MGSRGLTEAERAERRQADRDRLQHSVSALLSSEGWQRWVTVRSKNGLTRYSFGNQLLIAYQLPDATYVAGFRAFLALNRCVRKGERAIRILAPMSLASTDREARETEQDQAGEQQRRTVFRAVSVFDISQTDPLPDTEPVPVCPPGQPLTGDTHAHQLPALRELAGELGYTVTHQPTGSTADGWCDSINHEIVVNSEMPANGQVRVLIHEIAHATGIGYEDYGRRRAEVLVDTITFIVCGAIGLDISGDSVPYIAGWGGENAHEEIRAYAQAIDTAARRIEEKLQPQPATQPAKLAA
jgi:hypothetical protein